MRCRCGDGFWGDKEGSFERNCRKGTMPVPVDT